LTIEGIGSFKPFNYDSQPVKGPAKSYLDLAGNGQLHCSITGNIDFGQEPGSFFDPTSHNESIEKSFLQKLFDMGSGKGSVEV
jgi:hypothetical protein